MLVDATGSIGGTIGGGMMEYQAQRKALQVLEDRNSVGQDYVLNRSDKQNLGMICGGDCSVFFHYIPAGDAHTLQLVDEAETYFEEAKDLWLISDIGAGGALRLADRSDEEVAPYLKKKPYRLQENEKDWFKE